MMQSVHSSEFVREGRARPQNHERIREFLNMFSKGIKTCLLYPPDNPIPKEFKNSSWEKLQSYLKEFGSLALDVHQDSFQDRKHLIFKAPTREENLPGVMHRDGIRHVVFKEGLERMEWEHFFDDILTVIRGGENYEDLVNLFWQRDFVNIEYHAVEDLSLAEIEDEYASDQENLEMEYSDIVFSESQIDSSSVLEILNPEKEAVRDEYGQIFENIQKFSEMERNHIEGMVTADQELIIEFEAIDLIFDILQSEKEMPNYDESLNTVTLMFDKMLELEQFPLLVYLIKRMKLAYKEVKEVSAPRADKLKDCLTRVGDRIRISKITNLLNHSSNKDLEGIRLYLEELDWDSLPSMIWMLGELEYFPARRMVIKALVNKGRQRIDIIGNAIYDSRWYVIRNAALILGEIKDRRTLTYLSKALEHFDERVRWEALVAFEKTAKRDDLEVIVPMVDDESDRVRHKVIELLSLNRYQPAFDQIRGILSSGTFDDLEMDEQKALIKALAKTGGDEAIPILKKILKKLNLFASDKKQKKKETAILALASIQSEKAISLLENVARKNNAAGKFAKLIVTKLNSGTNEERH
jgi:hypothetical protein